MTARRKENRAYVTQFFRAYFENEKYNTLVAYAEQFFRKCAGALFDDGGNRALPGRYTA